MPLPKLQDYKMSKEEVKKAKEHLQLQMWYWRDSWSAENLSDMPDYIKHMYYMYGYVLWLQRKVDELERLTASVDRIIAVHTSNTNPVTHGVEGIPDGIIDKTDDGSDEVYDGGLDGTVVVSGGIVSIEQPSTELPRREDDTEDVDGIGTNRDGR